MAAGPAPLVFTLGSSAVLVAGRFWDESVAVVRELGARGLFLVGPGNAEAMRSTLPAEILAIDGTPHSLLFPRSDAVVQQCGVGTLAQSLRSGRPMLGVPYAHDQPDNAYRAERLGMARVVPAHRYAARRVVRELRALLHDPSYAEAAARTAQIVRSEGGVAAACDALEQRFGLR